TPPNKTQHPPLHDALPLFARASENRARQSAKRSHAKPRKVEQVNGCVRRANELDGRIAITGPARRRSFYFAIGIARDPAAARSQDRKSTRLNSSHGSISYA